MLLLAGRLRQLVPNRVETAILSLVCYAADEGMPSAPPSPLPTPLFGRFTRLTRLYEVPGIALWSCWDHQDDRGCIGVALATRDDQAEVPPVVPAELLGRPLLEPVAQGFQSETLAGHTMGAFWLVYAVDPQSSLWHRHPEHLDSRLSLLTELARTLTLAHGAGHAHGWLHPALVGEDENGLWLAGLHAVRLRQCLERSAEASSTSEPRLAPEVRGHAGETLTPACDAFSLGVLASELLAAFDRPVPAQRLLQDAQAHTASERPKDLLAWAQSLGTAMRAPTTGARTHGRGLGLALAICAPLLSLLAAWVAWRVHSAYLNGPSGPPPPPATPATVAETTGHGRLRNADATELPTIELPGAASDSDERALVPVSGNAPIWGDSQALVTAVLFGDLNCPFTRYTIRELAEIKRTMPHDLRLVFRHRPVTDAGRSLGATAARLYDMQGAPAFFRFSWLVSQEPHPVGPEFVLEQRDALGLSRAQTDQLLARTDAPHLEEDNDWALRYQVFKVPTLFVNGRRLEGLVGNEKLDQLIQEERRAQISLLAQGVPKEALYEHRVRNTFVGLDVKPPERYCVPLAGAPSKGSERAPISIVQFSDFECSYCAQFERTLDRLQKAFPGKIREVWLNFPLETHPNARTAANLALYGWKTETPATFWRLHHELLQMHEDLGPESYERLLKRLGLDVSSYLDAANGGANDSIIDANLRLAETLGIDGVPTLFINGRKLEGAQNFKVMQAVVREELQAMTRYQKAGFEPHSLSRLLCAPR